MMMHSIEEEEEVDPSFKSTRPRNLRIADILGGDEMEQPSSSMTVLQCSTPRRIVSRWFSSLKRRRRPTQVHHARIAHVPPHTATNSCSSDQTVRVDSSFNLGVACGLLCVVAAGKSELNKMVELRTQMELILQNAKKEMMPPPETSSSTTTNCQQEASTTSASGTQFSLQSGAARDDCAAGMDELEAELHAELERLQLQLDSEDSYSPRQQRPDLRDTNSNRSREEESASTDYSSDEMLWGSGVAPLELERKLHQVLEARQEERIKELEDALQCAEQKLQEKEMEVSWWRDTARLVSAGHDSEHSFSLDIV